MSRGAFEGKKFLVIDRQRVKRLWYITVQFETGEIDILDEKDVEYDEDVGKWSYSRDLEEFEETA